MKYFANYYYHSIFRTYFKQLINLIISENLLYVVYFRNFWLNTFLSTNYKIKYKFFKISNTLTFINFFCSFFVLICIYFIIMNKKLEEIQYIRKNLSFNKNRYTRVRQTVKTIFFFSLYINIIIILTVFSIFYGFIIKITYFWWFFYIFLISLIKVNF